MEEGGRPPRLGVALNSIMCDVPGCAGLMDSFFKGFATCADHLDRVIDWVRESGVHEAALNCDTVRDIVHCRVPPEGRLAGARLSVTAKALRRRGR